MIRVTHARLEHPSLPTLELNGQDGLRVVGFDLGWPEAREVANPRAGADGEIDETRFHSGRVVSMTLSVTDPGKLDALMAFTNPGLRPTLRYRVRGGGQRMIRLRASDLSRPVEFGVAEVDVQWRAPDGVAESVDLETQQLNPAEDVEGRTYDLTFDRSYPESQGAGRITVVNEGSATAYPIIRFYGPLEDPLLENETSDRQLRFEISISAGDYLEVDTANRTARLNGLAENSRYDAFDFPTSQWWGLRPGGNLLRFAPDSSSQPAVAEVRWRAAWL